MIDVCVHSLNLLFLSLPWPVWSLLQLSLYPCDSVLGERELSASGVVEYHLVFMYSMS